MMGKLAFVQNYLCFGSSSDLRSTIYRYKVGCDLPGKYRVALDSDGLEFGGHGRVRKPFKPNNVKSS